MASEELPEIFHVFGMTVRHRDLYVIPPDQEAEAEHESAWEDLPQGQPPASKAAIESMASVEIEEGGAECAICLVEWKLGGLAKEMPCKHRFHGDCIDKWLGIHGSCPVCRYTMPVDEAELRNNEDDGGDEQGREMTTDSFFGLNFSHHGVRRSTSSSGQ